MTNETAMRQRPGVVSLVGILIYISALLSAVNALQIFLNRDNELWNQVMGVTSTELLWLAIFEGIFALLLFGIGYGVMSGANGARLFVAIVYGFRLAVAFWFLLTHLGRGGFQWAVILQVVFALFVLWALYGNEESQYFFERM